VIALSLAAQARPPSNEARSVTRPGALFCSIFSARAAGVWQTPGVAQKRPVGGPISLEWMRCAARLQKAPVKIHWPFGRVQ